MEVSFACCCRSAGVPAGEGVLTSQETEYSSIAMENSFYDEIIAPISGRMMRTVWRILRDFETAEDAFQEALTVIWSRRLYVQKHANPQALILRICVNCAYDVLRKRKRLTRLEQSQAAKKSESESQSEGPLEILESESTREQVIRSIGRLPRKQALAVMLRVVGEQSYRDIAASMGCTETTARIHVSRGRARLSRWLSHLRPDQGE